MKNSLFLPLTTSFYFLNSANTVARWASCSFKFFEWTMMSSKNVPTNWPCSLKILSIIWLKVAGALVKPNHITKKFIQTKSGPECHLMCILWPDAYLMVPTLQVNATEDGWSLKTVEYVINPWNRKWLFCSKPCNQCTYATIRLSYVQAVLASSREMNWAESVLSPIILLPGSWFPLVVLN